VWACGMPHPDKTSRAGGEQELITTRRDRTSPRLTFTDLPIIRQSF